MLLFPNVSLESSRFSLVFSINLISGSEIKNVESGLTVRHLSFTHVPLNICDKLSIALFANGTMSATTLELGRPGAIATVQDNAGLIHQKLQKEIQGNTVTTTVNKKK